MRQPSLRGVVLLMGWWGACCAQGAVKEFGDRDLCNTGMYPTDPTAGLALDGTPLGSVNVSPNVFGHVFPFSPGATDLPGTDQIFVGTVQTDAHDGYSSFDGRLPGPQVVMLDYAELVPAGSVVATLTLGIMTDDFQRPSFGQPFQVTVNGADIPALSEAINALSQTGPVSQFVTVGIDPATLLDSGVLVLTVNEGGDGGDGWAIDFLTVGVTTVVPESGAGALAVAGGAGLLRRRR